KDIKAELAEIYLDYEIAESEMLTSALTDLETQLKKANAMAQYNALLQRWQQNTFRGLLDYYKIAQGKLSAAQHHFLPKENWANTYVVSTAGNILQNWEFGETSMITNEMLYRHDHGEVFHSACYHETNKRHLLFATYLSENLGPQLGIVVRDLDSVDNLNARTHNKFSLQHARDSYEGMRKKIAKESIEIKTRLKNEKTKFFPLPQESRLLEDWWDLWNTTTERNLKLKTYLESLILEEAKLSPNDLNNKLSKPTVIKNIKELSLAEAVKFGRKTLTKHAHKNYIFSSGDILTSSFRFLYDFVDYFDQMIEQHPYVATATFSVPYLQFGGIGLALAGHNTMLGIANLLADLESKILAGKVTASEINSLITVVDEFILWLTAAESSLQVMITCGFTVAKLSYTAFDVIINNWLSTLDESTTTVLAKLISPYSSLEGYNNFDTAKLHIANFMSGVILLIIAGSFGVGAAFTHTEIMEFFAHVPVNLVTNPSWQTIGAVKTSSLLLGKIAGVNNYMHKENLIDINGARLNPKIIDYLKNPQLIDYKNKNALHLNPSDYVLILFKLLSTGTIKTSPDKKEFKKLKRYFEKLLQLNPTLLGFYDITALKKLDVKLVTSRWYHAVPVSLIKSLFYAVMFAPALLGVIGYLAIRKPIPPILKLCVIVPLNWIVLTGKIAWNTLKTISHGFLQVAIRLPEATLQLAFLSLRAAFALVGGLAYLASCTIKAGALLFRTDACKDLPSQASNVFFNRGLNTLRKWQSTAVGWLRTEFRYRVERIFGSILKTCRDILVRIPEQWLQQVF
ncbi:MAG TPA: hypothetical protein VHA13_05110, partial [Gammaproteobacteria bacterium]|nr:hypothetical protein [Gammaproteobacteria bacterium]